MGRKNQGKTKSKQQHNLKNKEKSLINLVDKLLLLTVQAPNANISKELEEFKEIYSLIEQINLLEDCSKCDIQRDGIVLGRFVSWLKENGAKFDGVSIAPFEGYDLGLRADVDITKDDLIISIPRKIMLTELTAKNTCLSLLSETDVILKNMPNVVLAMVLLVEKFSSKSFWKPYIDALPNSYNTVLYYGLSDLQELVGSPTLKIALKQIKNICRQYAYFYKLIQSNEELRGNLKGMFSYKEYCWAVSTVMTRQNTIPSEDKSCMTSALIPLWDFCNHTNGRISTDYNAQSNISEFTALRDFKAGEQIFMFYGSRTNSELFIHNGFVHEENEHDVYGLNLGISQSDALRNKRMQLLEKLGINSNSTFYLKTSSQPIIGNLLAFLRIFNMSEDQLLHWLESDKCEDLKCLDCALDTCLEKKMWSFLEARLKLLLAAYKTSREDDEKLVKSNLSAYALLAVKMRLTEKKILSTVLSYVEQYVKQ